MRYIIIILVLSLLPNLGFGQIAFYKLFNDNGADFGQGIVQLEDSSYVITGASSSFGEGPTQAFLLKIDSLGNYLWSQSYGGAESDWGRRVLYQQNFGFFICGFTNSFGNGAYDFYLAKVDENANLEWEKSYGGTGWEKVHDAVLVADTGVIMVGETSSNATDNQDIFIVRTDINGDTIWTKTIGGAGGDFASSIKKYDDTTYIVGGRMYVEDSLLTKGYLMSIHLDGTINWQQTFGNNGDYWVNDFCFENNEILAVGAGDANTGFEIDPCTYRMNMGGGYLGEWRPGGIGLLEYQLITRYGISNDVYIVSNNEDAWSYPIGPDLAISRFAVPINWQTSFLVYHEKPDMAGQIIPTNDGGVIFVGYSTNAVSAWNEVIVVKIGPGDVYAAYPEVIDNLVIVAENEQASTTSIYPNPVSHSLNISSENDNFNQIVLINALGQKILQDNFKLEKAIDVSLLTEGYYLLEISGMNVSPVRKKIIIKH